MEQTRILERLTPIFRDVFDDDSITPTTGMTAEDVEEWDSLSHIRLIVAVEREWQIKFSAAEIGRLENVGQFADLIEKKIRV